VSIRILVADDQAVVRDGLVMLLSAAEGIEVVGVADNGRRAVDLVGDARPTVALLDLRMPELDGAGATAELAARHPEVRVLILTTYADDDAVVPALRAGAAGYLTKDASSEALVGAIRDVAAGRTVLDAEVQHRLVQRLRAEPTAAGPVTPPPPAAPDVDDEDLPAGLTRREVDVVRSVAEGLNNRQVARRLVVSEATVKTHLNHVLSKLDLPDRSALVAWAWRHGLGGA
jgi:DNA-binding NarL/FixJ family response regulator